jgi:hypothetical protein
MVPVPEEHVDAVQNFIRQKVTNWPTEFDPSTIEPLYRGGDDLSRRVLSIVASVSRRDESVGVPQLANLLECSTREAAGALIEINNRAVALAAAPFGILLLRDEREQSPESDPWGTRVVLMRPEVAEAVLAVAGADDASAS